MPIRLKMRPQPVRDLSPVSARDDFDLPDIVEDDSFRDVVKKLSLLVPSPRTPEPVSITWLAFLDTDITQLLYRRYRAAEYI